uniref:Hypothetical conserved protein n=1 Tax=Acetithermum autotrophicum TaxID=1446466 RepID=H5SVF6_ACEAU|nr:hypothetical conserved protein [Candidatus Acetothermum autotrophicum]
MSLIKVKEKYRVTLPAEIREKLPLKVGDLLEVSLDRNRIILKPCMAPERMQAVEKFFKVLTQRGKPRKRIKDKEAIADALEAIQEVRRLKHAQGRS